MSFSAREFRVISFDCYGTLMDWESGILGALRPILAAHGAEASDGRILRLYGEAEVALWVFPRSGSTGRPESRRQDGGGLAPISRSPI